MGMIADLWARLSVKPDKESFKKATGLLDGIKAAVFALVGAAAIGAVVGMVDHVAELGGRLDDVSQQIGVSAESLQELGFAAKESGSDMDVMIVGLKKLSLGLITAVDTGKGPVVDAFNAMGISVSTLKDKMSGEGGLDDVLGVVAEKFSTMEAGPRKAALAVDLFGKAGTELIPLLNNGAAGLDKLRARANELGVVMSNEAVGSLATFGDDVDELKFAFQGLKQQAVIALLPALRNLVTSLRDWIIANKELVRDTIKTVIEGVVGVLRALGFVVVNVVVPAIRYLLEHSEAVKVAMIALGAIMTAFAIKAAAAWVIALAPILLVVGVIAAVGLAVYKLYKNWDLVRKGARIATQFIARAMLGVENKINAAGKRVMEFFVEDIPNAIRAAFDAAEKFIIEKLASLDKSLHDNKVLNVLMKFTPGDDARSALKEQLDQLQTDTARVQGATPAAGGAAAPTRAADGTTASSVQIRTGDTKIEINGTADPKVAAAEVAKILDQRNAQTLLEIEEVIG